MSIVTAAAAAALLASTSGPLVVDSFAGGGGASTGLSWYFGKVDLAINHDPAAIAMHEENHLETVHVIQNIWRVDPEEVTRGRKIKAAWFSPDCTHHSKARGGKPREKGIRDLSWTVVLWAERVSPEQIYMENVEEILSWGPLDDDGFPIKQRAGETWGKFLKGLRRAGYRVQFKPLRACDYGAPTIRKRLYLIARCDGKRIAWPKPTHGKPGSKLVLSGKLKPYRTAADSVIDFTIPCPSIFTRKKELADNTLRRIAHGIMKFVVNSDDPFIVPVTHHGGPGRAYSSDGQLPTITSANRGELAAVEPFVVPVTNSKWAADRAYSGKEPLRTITTAKGGEFTAVVPHVTRFRSGQIGQDMREPLSTVTANSFVKRPGGAPPLGVVAATMAPLQNGERRPGEKPREQDIRGPVSSIATGGKHSIAEAHLAPVTIGAGGPEYSGKPRAADQPLGVVQTENHRGVTGAVLINTRNGERVGQEPRASDTRRPHPTVTAKGSQGAVAEVTMERIAVHMAQHNTDKQPKAGRSVEAPVSTILNSGSHQGVVASSIVRMKGTCRHGQETDAPLGNIEAQGTHWVETESALEPLPLTEEQLIGANRVYAFLLKYYGTDQDPRLLEPLHVVTTKDRFALVTVTINGETYAIVDIGMRMLMPRELYNAQGFPPDYVIEFDYLGKPLTKSQQIEKCGNSVCPPVAFALVAANNDEAGVMTEFERIAA